MDQLQDNEELKDLLRQSGDPLQSSGQPITEHALSPQSQPAQLNNIDVNASGNNQLASEQQNDITKLLHRFMSVADTVLANHNADREQIEQAINFLGNIVKLSPKAPRVYVEMWVAAMRTKAETTANAVKLMDSFAKLLAAGKGTQIFVGQHNFDVSSDLIELLKTPEFPDEADGD
ncbi:MAG: hypothetical protein QXU32_00735 [Nitrososphaerales archaeon]